MNKLSLCSANVEAHNSIFQPMQNKLNSEMFQEL